MRLPLTLSKHVGFFTSYIYIHKLLAIKILIKMKNYQNNWHNSTCFRIKNIYLECVICCFLTILHTRGRIKTLNHNALMDLQIDSCVIIVIPNIQRDRIIMLRVIAYFFRITLELASIHGSNKISFILFES